MIPGPPTSSSARSTLNRGSVTRPPAPPAAEDGDYVGVSELASAAGDGAFFDNERITGRIKFRPDVARPPRPRRPQLPRDHGQRRVHGADAGRRLLDPGQPRQPAPARRANLFVVRTDDGLIVKRAGRDDSGAWQLVSDNSDKHVWPNRPWPADAGIVGEVKWAARTFV